MDDFEALTEDPFAGGVLRDEVTKGILGAHKLLEFRTVLPRAVGAVGTLNGDRRPGLRLHAPTVCLTVLVQDVQLEDGLFRALFVLEDFFLRR